MMYLIYEVLCLYTSTLILIKKINGTPLIAFKKWSSYDMSHCPITVPLDTAFPCATFAVLRHLRCTTPPSLYYATFAVKVASDIWNAVWSACDMQ